MAAIWVGVAQAAGVERSAYTVIAQLIGIMTGSGASSPAMLIFTGLGLIGIRAKLDRAL